MLDFEKQVIGCAINNPKQIPTMMSTGLCGKMFHYEESAKLWDYLALRFLSGSESPLVPPAPLFYADCSAAAITLNPEVMAKEQVADFKRKKLANAMSCLATDIMQTEPFQKSNYQDDALKLLIEATTGDGGFITPGYDDVANRLTNRLQERVDEFKSGKRKIITTGFKPLDNATGGFVARRLYVIAARTGCGKTTLATNMADAACEAGASVGFFTVEMEDIEILEKIISKKTMIGSRSIDSGDLSHNESQKIADELFKTERKLYINHNFRANYEKLEVEIRRLKASYGVNVVFIDYIQQLRMSEPHRMRHIELSEISSKLKNLAMELEIAIVVLAQLNRDATEDVPQLHHIKDSGSIEQDADFVSLIHHEDDSFGGKTPWLRIEKNRRGPRGKFRMHMDLPVNLFEDHTDPRLVD